MTSEERQSLWNDFIEMRGVQTPCRRCQGLGTYAYGNTATWHGGIGGAAMTNGICNWCWGSGDDIYHWLNLKDYEAMKKNYERIKK